MAATSTTKLAPRVSKTPDPDFVPQFDPAYDHDDNQHRSQASRHQDIRPQGTSPWVFVWMVLILVVAGFVAYRYYYDGTSLPAPATSQTTTTIAPPDVPAAPAAPATPPEASATAPAAPADGSTTAPQAPATTTSP